ncbi:MAG: ribokinase [Cellulosilyticaceae bacterium]
MKKIFVFGSLNMDMVINTPYIPQNGETLHGSGFMYNPGGKGANQAVACSKLGGDTYMIGKVGKDMFASQLIDTLKGYNVHTDNVFESEKTTSGIAVILKCDNDNRIVLDAGSNFDITLEEVESVLNTQTAEGDLWIAQLETPMEVVEASFKLAKAKGLYTLFNPAPAKKIQDETYAYVDLIVLNQSECEIMTGTYPETDEDYGTICDYFTTRGVKEVIITLGSKGSVLYKDGKTFKYEADKVKAVDTTAAGDSYIGSLAYSLSAGRKLEESIGEASKVAAMTVMKHGAQAAIPTREELRAYMNN